MHYLEEFKDRFWTFILPTSINHHTSLRFNKYELLKLYICLFWLSEYFRNTFFPPCDFDSAYQQVRYFDFVFGHSKSFDMILFNNYYFVAVCGLFIFVDYSVQPKTDLLNFFKLFSESYVWISCIRSRLDAGQSESICDIHHSAITNLKRSLIGISKWVELSNELILK